MMLTFAFLRYNMGILSVYQVFD